MANLSADDLAGGGETDTSTQTGSDQEEVERQLSQRIEDVRQRAERRARETTPDTEPIEEGPDGMGDDPRNPSQPSGEDGVSGTDPSGTTSTNADVTDGMGGGLNGGWQGGGRAIPDSIDDVQTEPAGGDGTQSNGRVGGGRAIPDDIDNVEGGLPSDGANNRDPSGSGSPGRRSRGGRAIPDSIDDVQTEQPEATRSDLRASANAATSGSGELARGVDATDFALFQPGVDAVSQQVQEQYPGLDAGEDFTANINQQGGYEVELTAEGREKMAGQQRDLRVAAAAATSGPGELARATPAVLTYQQEASAEAERRAAAARNSFLRGNFGNTNQIVAEQAATELSDQYEFIDADDVDVSSAGGGDFNVALTPQAQRAAALAGSAEFLRRDAEIQENDAGALSVEIGDSNMADALETALTRKIRTGEAAGDPNTTINFLGQTLTLEKDLEAVGDWTTENVAEPAAQFVDDANLLRPNAPPFVAGDADQDAMGSPTPMEASEDLLAGGLESGISGAGQLPKDTLELTEAATSPVTWGVLEGLAADAGNTEIGLNDELVSPADTRNAIQGTIETSERVDAAARENPEVAAGVAEGLIGAAGLTAASYGAGSAALRATSGRAPRTASALEFALDPVKVSARTGSRAAGRARRAAPDIDLDGGPEVSLVEDPNSGFVDVAPGVGQELRRGLSSRTPSPKRARSRLAERIAATRRRANVELANVELRRRSATETLRDVSVRDAVESGQDVAGRARDTVTGTAKGAALSTDAAAYNARQRLSDLDVGDALPSGFFSRGDSLIGPVEGRATGAAIDAQLAAGSVRGLSLDDVVPSLPTLRSSDQTLGRAGGALASLNVNTRLAARRARDLEARDLLPSRGDSNSLVGPVRGRVFGAAVSGEAAVRRTLDTDPSDLLPSPPDTPSVRDLTLRIEPSRPPRTPMTRTIDADSADLTREEADVFDAFDDVSGDAAGGGTATLAGRTFEGADAGSGQVALTRRPTATRSVDVTDSRRTAGVFAGGETAGGAVDVGAETIEAGSTFDGTYTGSVPFAGGRTEVRLGDQGGQATGPFAPTIGEGVTVVVGVGEGTGVVQGSDTMLALGSDTTTVAEATTETPGRSGRGGPGLPDLGGADAPKRDPYRTDLEEQQYIVPFADYQDVLGIGDEERDRAPRDDFYGATTDTLSFF